MVFPAGPPGGRPAGAPGRAAHAAEPLGVSYPNSIHGVPGGTFTQASSRKRSNVPFRARRKKKHTSLIEKTCFFFRRPYASSSTCLCVAVPVSSGKRGSARRRRPMTPKGSLGTTGGFPWLTKNDDKMTLFALQNKTFWKTLQIHHVVFFYFLYKLSKTFFLKPVFCHFVISVILTFLTLHPVKQRNL